MENIFVEFLPPWIETGLQPAFYDKESGTVLQQTARMYARVNMLIRMFNKLSKNTKTTVEDYINKFNELYNYVHDYFDNLDVQEEINNKLDDMVEDGTFAEILNEYLSIDYIFPKHENETYSTWGDITIAKFNNKVICIDTGLGDRWNEIHLMLLTKNISHFDVLSISHYHDDHIGNLENLITAGYVDSNTTVYLCGDVTSWSDIVTLQTYYKTVLDNASITYRTPSEGEIVDFYGLKLQFHNVTNLDSLYYQYGDYNACSMITTITYKNHKSMFTGDATRRTIEHLYNTGVAKERVDLYKSPHHAIQEDAYLPFIQSIHPNTVVVISSPTDNSRQINAYNQECDYVERYGGLVYTTFTQSDYLEFRSSGEEAICINGYPNNISSALLTKTVYVDGSVESDSLQDGSESKPYKNIQQAIGRSDKHYDVLTINVADGTYIPFEGNNQKNIIKISGTNCGRIEIIGNTTNPGNVVVAGTLIENSNVVFKGLTFKTDSYYYDVSLNNSIVTFEKVNIGDSSYSHYSGITTKQSLVYLQNCTISYQKNALTLQTGSFAFINGTTFDNITENFINGNNCSYNTRNITVTNSYLTYFPLRKNINSPIVLTATKSDATFTSTIPFSTFESLRISITDDDYDEFVIEIPVRPTNRHKELYQTFFSGDGVYIYEYYSRITLNPTDNTISFSRKYQTSTVVNTGNKTITTPDHVFYYTKIEGVFAPAVS